MYLNDSVTVIYLVKYSHVYPHPIRNTFLKIFIIRIKISFLLLFIRNVPIDFLLSLSLSLLVFFFISSRPPTNFKDIESVFLMAPFPRSPPNLTSRDLISAIIALVMSRVVGIVVLGSNAFSLFLLLLFLDFSKEKKDKRL